MNGLGAFFKAARHETETLPGTLAERMLADALRVQDSRQTAAPSARPGTLRQILDMLGGWPSIGGLITACAVGVWLGFSPPQALENIVGLDQGDNIYFDQDSLVLAMAEER